jgi:hypothetical protein
MSQGNLTKIEVRAAVLPKMAENRKNRPRPMFRKRL